MGFLAQETVKGNIYLLAALPCWLEMLTLQMAGVGPCIRIQRVSMHLKGHEAEN